MAEETRRMDGCSTCNHAVNGGCCHFWYNRVKPLIAELRRLKARVAELEQKLGEEERARSSG